MPHLHQLALVFLLTVTTVHTSSGGLLCWWRFDEPAESPTAIDSSGNRNHGRLANFDLTPESGFIREGGKFGGALQFDGDDDRVINKNGFQPNGCFTYAYFFKPDSPDYSPGHTRSDHLYSDARPHVSFSKERPTGDQARGWEGQLGIYTEFDREVSLRSTTNTWSDKEWHFVAWIYDGTSLSFYLNGEQESSIAVSGFQQLQRSGRFYAGGGQAGGYAFDGAIDELTIWDEALSPADLLSIHAGGVEEFLRSSKRMLVIPPSASGVVVQATLAMGGSNDSRLELYSAAAGEAILHFGQHPEHSDYQLTWGDGSTVTANLPNRNALGRDLSNYEIQITLEKTGSPDKMTASIDVRREGVAYFSNLLTRVEATESDGSAGFPNSILGSITAPGQKFGKPTQVGQVMISQIAP